MSHWPILASGVDWISATATDLAARQRALKRLDALGRIEEGEGNARRAWRWRGYNGWQCGSLAVGEREDSLYCQLGSATASEGWLALADLGMNVTRLDLQVTVSEVPTGVSLAVDAHEQLEADPERARLAHWYSLTTTRPAGDTLYVGAPSSRLRLRLYDKHAESKGVYPVGSWRYEVQARDGLAGSFASGLVDRDRSDVASQSTVHHYFSARGITPGFRPGGRSVLGSVPRSRSDAERRLKWLREQVRPTVAWLFNAGYGDSAINALGLYVRDRELED